MNVGPSVRVTVQSSYVQRESTPMAMGPCRQEPPYWYDWSRDPPKGVFHQGLPEARLWLDWKHNRTREHASAQATPGHRRQRESNPPGGEKAPGAVNFNTSENYSL